MVTAIREFDATPVNYEREDSARVLPPSRGQKANAEPPAVKQQHKGRPGVARKLAEKPDATLLR